MYMLHHSFPKTNSVKTISHFSVLLLSPAFLANVIIIYTLCYCLDLRLATKQPLSSKGVMFVHHLTVTCLPVDKVKRRAICPHKRALVSRTENGTVCVVAAFAQKKKEKREEIEAEIE